MLRESSEQEGQGAELRGVTDPEVVLGVDQGETLRSLADALVARDRTGTDAATTQIVEALGETAAVTAIGVVANFQMMNRALDAVGIPSGVDLALAGQLGIDPDAFGGAHGSV